MITPDQKYIRKIKKELKGKTQKELIEMVIHMDALLINASQIIEALRGNNAARNADYLSRCRSVGGVTLPPGV